MQRSSCLNNHLYADSPYAELEAVTDSWTKQSFTGIRALPEALEHGFRQKALYETVMRGEAVPYSQHNIIKICVATCASQPGDDMTAQSCS